MNSLRHLYKIGVGPSSSHTMAPERAAELFRAETPQADAYRVVLYGSLALTGRGHGTDRVLKRAFAPIPCEVVFDTVTADLPHPNTLDFAALKDGAVLASERVLSIGGGSYRILGREMAEPRSYYAENSFAEIAAVCRRDGLRIWQYVDRTEGGRLQKHLTEVWATMKAAIERGLAAEGILAGGLGTERRAKFLHDANFDGESPQTRETRILCSYAFAVSEENAAGGVIVTAPTCGACGVLPAVLRYTQITRGFGDAEILHALATAGVIGNLIKQNASISGAECGCQAEIGSACSMAAAALAELNGMSLEQIEYAAEVAMEHHLGLTCDPICGLVQIPCIERNAVAAMRALNAYTLAQFLTNSRKISFDMIVRTMYETGKDLSTGYRETAEAGLAKTYGEHAAGAGKAGA